MTTVIDSAESLKRENGSVADAEDHSNNNSSRRKQNDKQGLRGFGSIYQRGRIWHVGYWDRGKWHRKSSRSESRADAEKLLKSEWKKIGKGRIIGPGAGLCALKCFAGVRETGL